MYRTHLLGPESDDGDRPTGERHELDLEGGPTGVDMDHGPEIPGLEIGLREALRQNHDIVFSNTDDPSRGVAMTPSDPSPEKGGASLAGPNGAAVSFTARWGRSPPSG